MINRKLSILIIATILITISQGANLTNAQIYSITPYNVKQYMGCIYDPLYCTLKRDWLLLFYNSSNDRQVQTLQYLIPGYIKQFNFAKETKKQVGNLYPPTALIDCYSCISLCNGVGQKDLPLAIYKDKENRKNIRYRGYISLIGLISFIKSHDPTTSYLAELYQPQGKIIKGQDFSKKEIKQIINKLQQNFERFNKQVQKTQHKNEIKAQLQNQIKKDQRTKQNKKIQNQQKQKINQKIQQVQIKIKTENIYQSQNIQKVYQDKEKSQKSINNVDKIITDQTKNTKTKLQKQKKISSNSKKQKSKNQRKSDFDQFLAYVEGSSEFFVDMFASIGLPKFMLQIIGWITYIFFFIFFGTICVVVNAL